MEARRPEWAKGQGQGRGRLAVALLTMMATLTMPLLTMARRPEWSLFFIEPGQQRVIDSVRRDIKDDEDARGKGLPHLVYG